MEENEFKKAFLDNNSNIDKILNAVAFAAEKHKSQRRKGTVAAPYINHPIAVAKLVTGVGKEYDISVIQGAILHDTIEDTETTAEELLGLFGKEVTDYVVEMTDDKSIPKSERKRLQVVNAPHKSHGAKLIKICDKISNITDVTNDPPTHWNLQRRNEYLEWAKHVVDALGKVNKDLESLFIERYNRGKFLLEAN
jgi:guanosine-3',5'-bis(diphosphate) 3'-pyrophosphohydrolase